MTADRVEFVDDDQCVDWRDKGAPVDVEFIQRMLRRHFQYTRSEKADDILRKWDKFAPKFVKVMPQDYKRALAELAKAENSSG